MSIEDIALKYDRDISRIKKMVKCRIREGG